MVYKLSLNIFFFFSSLPDTTFTSPFVNIIRERCVLVEDAGDTDVPAIKSIPDLSVRKPVGDVEKKK